MPIPRAAAPPPGTDFLGRWGAEFLEETGCPVCATPKSKPVRRLGPTVLRRCGGCGLHFISPRLSAAAAEAMYRLNPSPLSPQREAMLHNLMAGRMRDLRRERFSVAPNQLRRLSVLDLGCGFGHFLAECRADYGSVEGTELSPLQSGYAREKLGLQVATADVLSVDWPHHYDLITAWEVVEHLPRPADLLRWAFAHLRPGGQLMLSTPNHNSLFRRALGRHWFYYIPSQHLTHFTAAGLTRLLRAAGFAEMRTFTSGRSLLRERGNDHNAPSPGDARRQWTENLRIRAGIEVERESPPAGGSALLRRAWNAFWWRLIYWPVHHGCGDQLRVYALKSESAA